MAGAMKYLLHFLVDLWLKSHSKIVIDRTIMYAVSITSLLGYTYLGSLGITA
jgi:hypothetical protein